MLTTSCWSASLLGVPPLCRLARTSIKWSGAGAANARPPETETVTRCVGDTYGLRPHRWWGRVWNPSWPAVPEARRAGCLSLRLTAITRRAGE